MNDVPVDDVIVEDRHRSDLGAVEDLAASIRDYGLLHPVVITPDMRLVAGERRLAAVRTLGWDRIPVTVAESLTDAAALLRAERDENTQRKDFLPSEIASIGRALEALYRPEAEARKAEGQQRGADVTAGRLTAPGITKPSRVREQVGAALGIGGATYQRITAIAKDAADPDLPQDRTAAGARASSGRSRLGAMPRLIDARAAGELLGVPASWVLREARADRIPHIRLGRYVRFDPEELTAWWKARVRGPAR